MIEARHLVKMRRHAPEDFQPISEHIRVIQVPAEPAPTPMPEIWYEPLQELHHVMDPNRFPVRVTLLPLVKLELHGKPRVVVTQNVYIFLRWFAFFAFLGYAYLRYISK
jgi:hypothetical protein